MGFFILAEFDEEEKEVFHEILSVLNQYPNFKKYQFEHSSILKFDNLEIYLDSRKVYHNRTEQCLTFTEFEILYLLARNPGRVFSKEQIYDIVWNEPYFGDYNIVMSHIRHIREKIEDDPGRPIYIQTVWGVGYRFNKNMSSVL